MFRPTGTATVARAGVRAGCPHPAGPCGGTNAPGGYGIRPYERGKARGYPGKRGPRQCRKPSIFEFAKCGGRERPPYGTGKHGGRPGKCDGVRSRGRAMALPYKPGGARGYPGNRKLHNTANLCMGRCSHRPAHPRAAANTRGRDKSRPYEQGARSVTNREHANPAMPQTPVGADSISARFAPPRAPAGGINPAPTNKFYVLCQ